MSFAYPNTKVVSLDRESFDTVASTIRVDFGYDLEKKRNGSLSIFWGINEVPLSSEITLGDLWEVVVSIGIEPQSTAVSVLYGDFDTKIESLEHYLLSAVSNYVFNKFGHVLSQEPDNGGLRLWYEKSKFQVIPAGATVKELLDTVKSLADAPRKETAF